MVELNGTLAEIGLPSIVHLLGELRETGLLRITSGNWTAELAFDDGVLISAAFGQERGLDALSAAVLMLGNGDFAFVEGKPTVESDIVLAPEELYQRLEELAANQSGQTALVPSLDAVPHLEAQTSSAADQVVLERSALQVLLHVDGQRTVRAIIGDGPVVPALRSLTLLVQQGLISIEPPSTRPAPPARRPAPRARPAPPPVVSVPKPVTPLAPEDGILGACPKLGFADDAGRHYPRPTALHRCYAGGSASLVTSQEQRELCLGGRFQSCPRFASAVSAAAPPAEAPLTPAVPPGVAARMATAQSMQLPETVVDEVPSWIGSDDRPAVRPAALSRLPRLGRGPLLIAGGAALGLVIVLGGLLALPLVQQPRLVQGSPTAVPAFAATGTTAPVRTTPPLAANTPAAAASSVAQPTSAPTTPPRLPTPTTGQLATNALLDTRFAVGVQKDWLENPPFAGWRDGAYRLYARQSMRFVAVGAPVRVPDDVVVSATLRKTGGPPGGGYGLIVRNQTPEALNGINQTFDGYVLETGDLGEFGVWRRDGEHWVDLVPWTRSPAVRQGGSPNDISVRLAGSQLLLSINGIEVARVDDDVLAHGGVGVFAGGDNNEVALDRFTVQVP